MTLSPLERRQRLAACVAKLADQIAQNEHVPSRLELQVLAAMCTEHFLPREAAELQRWAGHV